MTQKKTTEMTPQEEKMAGYLTFVLRHRPQAIGLTLDGAGWASVSDLLARTSTKKFTLTESVIERLVRICDKNRFEYTNDGLKIRARQGHSVPVDLGLPALQPPSTLFHGTATHFVEGILTEGICRKKRHDVHLISDRETAISVGERYGAPEVLVINTAEMFAENHVFTQTGNGVWLVNHVPAKYISRS